MALIHVFRPPKSAMNPNRPISSLIKSQVEYLNDAERRLPLRYRSETYANAIKTEGEAANYIREVTEAIHRAHEDAANQRTRRTSQRQRGIEIAAVTEERPVDERPTKKRPTKKKNKVSKIMKSRKRKPKR